LGKRRSWGWLAKLATLFALAAVPARQAGAIPAGYPQAYRQIVEQASRERTLVVYSTADRREVAPVLADFQRLYPFLNVQYLELGSGEIYNRVVREAAARGGTADLVWSGAMDLQIKLVNDGYAQVHASPEKPALPAWAIWKNEAYGVTAEPVVFAYNRDLMPPADVPRTHEDLVRLLRAKRGFYAGKIAAYDPVRSSSGYLYWSQDLQANLDTWSLVRELGAARATFHGTSKEMLDRLATGQSLFAYNVLGSYALERLRSRSIGVVMPSDYTLIMSRIALIPKGARHLNAARLLLDYLLSRRGQRMLSQRFMTPVRADIAPPGRARPATGVGRAIRVGPALLVNLDQLKRRRFLAQWRRNVNAAPARP
jgi:iron(III) transport system substrate-binding protein